MSERNYHRGAVFGVFDGLHEGHRYFLAEAKKRSDELVVVLTLSETALLLKGRAPLFSYEDRASAIKAFIPGVEIIPADVEPGTWSVFRDRAADVAILGYDQQGIARELEKIGVPLAFIGSHHPETYKSSLLRKPRS